MGCRAMYLACETAAVSVGGFEEHIGRFQVAIDDAQRVQVVHASRHVDEAAIHRLLVYTQSHSNALISREFKVHPMIRR